MNSSPHPEKPISLLTMREDAVYKAGPVWFRDGVRNYISAPGARGLILMKQTQPSKRHRLLTNLAGGLLLTALEKEERRVGNDPCRSLDVFVGRGEACDGGVRWVDELGL